VQDFSMSKLAYLRPARAAGGCFLYAILVVADVRGDVIMYGGLGGHANGDSTNDGALALVSQTTGAVTIVGHPAGVARLTGIAFDSAGNLFATTSDNQPFPPPVPNPRTSNLLLLDRNTGAILRNIGPVHDAAGAMNISRIAIQPGTDKLFAVRSPEDQTGQFGKLYTIDKTTGLATLIGDTHAFFAAIAFAPDGRLFEAAADLNFQTGDVLNIRLQTLNPATGAVLTSVPTVDYLPALGFRPGDGVLFAGTGDSHQLFTVNPLTGALTLVGDTGTNFVSSLSFGPAPVPEPSTLALFSLGALGLLGHAWRRRKRVALAE
jgi:hypothetical protein